MRLSTQDKELIEIATKTLKNNCDIYPTLSFHVASALRAKSGKVYIGMNVKTSHAVCAEQVALGQAFANGERKFDTIVAVKMDNDGNIRVVSPCGLCRYIFSDLKLDLKVIVPETNKKNIKVKVDELLPFPYIKD